MSWSPIRIKDAVGRKEIDQGKVEPRSSRKEGEEVATPS
jgi:hypothetical protein